MKKVKEIKNGYLAVPDEARGNYSLQEQFKSEVDDKQVKFPKELGVEHPFEFEDAEKAFNTIGLVNGSVNKFVDRIIGEFNVECKNPKALVLIKQLNKDSALSVHLREWVTEGILKGNGFMDLTNLKENKVRAINANNCYVVRDKKATLKGYNQFLGKSFNSFKIESSNVIPFKPNEIAHLKINALPGDAYGRGLMMPSERVIENLVINEQDLQKLVSRKAGAPIHVKVGQPGEIVDNSVTQSISNDLKYMTNRTEWVTNADVEMKVLDFGDVGKNLTDTANHNIEMFCYSTQIPAVLLGMANVAEGLGKEQGESLDRTISSIQEIIETEIESKIYKPYLLLNGLDAEVNFIWNLPGEEEINLRLTQLNTMMANPFISDGMRRQMQIEIGRLLHFEDAEVLVDTPNTQGQTADKNPTFDPDGKLFEPKANKETQTAKNDNQRKKEEEKPQPIIPGEVAKIEVTEHTDTHTHTHTVECKQIKETDVALMKIKEFVNLVEMPGFNYTDYMINILKRLKIDKFDNLQAITESDLDKGLLTSEQVDKLRVILKDGFRKNKSISDIEVEIRDSLNLKDRIREDGGIIPAELRPNMISRTETLRLANLGLIDTYRQNNIEKCRWLAAYEPGRTCAECEGLNGRVMELNEFLNIKAEIHPNCRCSSLAIIE